MRQQSRPRAAGLADETGALLGRIAEEGAVATRVQRIHEQYQESVAELELLRVLGHQLRHRLHEEKKDRRRLCYRCSAHLWTVRATVLRSASQRSRGAGRVRRAGHRRERSRRRSLRHGACRRRRRGGRRSGRSGKSGRRGRRRQRSSELTARVRRAATGVGAVGHGRVTERELALATGERMPALQPLLLDECEEAAHGAIVRVEHDLRQTDHLRGAIPAVAAVHQHRDTAGHQFGDADRPLKQ
mmetsp:Transcript_6975/g.21242  ORF Transcript_6975/g.21242 Transcript_6975/m.21242 type:complete len:244 (-) Transcript_6975:96-827(-)